MSGLPAAYCAYVERVLAERAARGRQPHRQLPKPPYRKARELDGVLYTVCRLCDHAIATADGRPNRRRLWHPECVNLYLAATNPAKLREQVFRRDHGLCAGCCRECARRAEDGEQWWRRNSQTVDGVSWVIAHEWEADHILPIIDGGSLTLDNVQTLCAACHRAKTAREATERAQRRRQASLDETGQMSLLESAMD